ncbi:hypothetical protein L2E82_11630 [Cichorium intybus]|uniref:Uncharacterized protein n=1 Tax=Cichorium intybus TaxID=13427 RepID=A0ACB9GDQ4_CICIN|nr:hypothetical protein L2E82_11630 [Cichorium intybus]
MIQQASSSGYINGPLDQTVFDVDDLVHVEVKEQRLTNVIQALMVGGCVAAMPVLKKIPTSVLGGTSLSWRLKVCPANNFGSGYCYFSLLRVESTIQHNLVSTSSEFEAAIRSGDRSTLCVLCDKKSQESEYVSVLWFLWMTEIEITTEIELLKAEKALDHATPGLLRYGKASWDGIQLALFFLDFEFKTKLVSNLVKMIKYVAIWIVLVFGT